jgi:hypothetical protein
MKIIKKKNMYINNRIHVLKSSYSSLLRIQMRKNKDITLINRHQYFIVHTHFDDFQSVKCIIMRQTYVKRLKNVMITKRYMRTTLVSALKSLCTLYIRSFDILEEIFHNKKKSFISLSFKLYF